jgi:hypothetical protein
MKTESPAIRHCNLISSWVALMKSIVRGSRKNKVGHAACLAFAGLIGACASDPRPVVLGTPLTLPALNDYCAVAQKEVATARVPARNMLMNDYQSFSRVSPSVKPLEVLQFVDYADPQHTKPRMISCKLHSADRIRAEYGATAAGESSTCARLNRRTLDAVMLTLTERQKKKMPFKGTVGVMLEPDLVASNESEWLEAFTMVSTDAGGTLRIRAKSLGTSANLKVRNGASGNGRTYCHLIAPDYLKRILAGEVQLPKAEFPLSSKNGQTAAR